jgi:hypothetical protein
MPIQVQEASRTPNRPDQNRTTTRQVQQVQQVQKLEKEY